ncbi:hypothetical protein B0I72DRAFT_160146 [Yarrowia lipolytica]|jgi:hypothetical protein|uniref:Uncharacterized protein n=1 Tax=Yarrowia lipolytica TaxID=4952 RepID=A0A371CDT9_YARLL|nr:Hypothetical protein YALI2_C00915g [Yarrowia lipolytica]RDW28452.1 hypothetical protein B0I71DRAFT_76954 [Yarrowia lipolytica]RDW31017.1 hypothetical protein B0I72DRAFT_160146 [Yarrowia lipolytica]RDW37678.1 hypothetical protein B0I73DRAFT_87154 [Yarrowia lipolytica]RDW45094.1 hypothetical protein B0I74DRAFT_85088 [Yarrowia lipolytica]
MTEPLVINISELRKYKDIDAKSMLMRVGRWYFYQLGELQKTQHDLELFQQLVYRFKFISAAQEKALRKVNLESYPNKHLFGISVHLDGTETLRFYGSEGTPGGIIHAKDQRLDNEPIISPDSRNYPRVGDTDFEVPSQQFPYLSYGAMLVIAVFLVAFITKKLRHVDKRRD